MFRLPTPRLLSGLKSALRPAMPRFKVSAFWLLILAWIFLLVWIWWKGPTWTLYEEQWLKPLANRWLATAAWGIIALMWLTVRVMKRLQQLEKMQKQQREEAVDPLSVELNAQQRYLDRWLLRLQRYLDNRRFLWQLPWYMVIGPAGSGKTTLLREGFPSDIIYAPEGARGAEQRLYLTPHVGKQAVIFDIDGTLCAPADADICDKLQQVELKRVPRVENLLYFMQNTRKRLEPQLKSNTENAAQTTVRTLIYVPETQASSTPEAVVPPLPGLPEMKVEVRSLTENPPQASVIKQGSTVRGFIAGIACSVAVASALWWWQVYPVQQQLLQVNDTAQGAATVWMASPELENYERRLQQLLDTSPVQPLETGMQMMRVADSRWPESLQQQQASTQWNEALKTRAQSSPQLRGWLQTRQDLHAFADLVMQREKEGLTLSYIKNVIWQAERGLGQETPVESLLTQYHDARAQKQNTDALEKQINERLEGVLSRWLLLKNNVMPEAATGTTAEK